MLYCRVFYAYANWQQLMDKLDSKPISAFILTGTPTFTTYDDIRDVVLKMGDLKGFFGQDIDAVREQIETMPWIKGRWYAKYGQINSVLP